MDIASQDTYGIISLIPVAVVIIMAVITKRALESLLIGTVVGAAIIAQGGWFGYWLSGVQTEIGDSAYFILMFGAFGAFMKILEKTGSAMGFAEIGAKVAKGKKPTLIFTWVLGIIIFVEDYLNALGVGVAMRNLTDKYRIPREYLAFVVNSTGAAVCILVPFSSWGIVYSSYIEDTGLLEGAGISHYTQAIPFMLYAWIAVLIVPLFILGIIPIFGPMKKSIARTEETGKVFPEYHYLEDSGEGLTMDKSSSAINFILPMVFLIGVTIWTKDILLGVLVAIVVSVIMLLPQRLMTIGQFCDYTLEGFKDMLYVTALVLIAFVLQDVNDALGLTPYVIDTVAPLLSPSLFPMVIFIVIGILAFATGSFWGIAAISFPIVLPLAFAVGVNPYMAIGAVTAATALGSHTCFYSDAVTVTCAATGLKNMDYAKTALPLIMVPFAIAIVLYLIVGIVMA